MPNLIEPLYTESELKAAVDKIVDEILTQEKVESKYIEILHNMPYEKRAEIINKIKEKYDSDEYYSREIHKCHREPMTCLYWVLFFYATKYGKQMTQEKDNPFTHDVYLIDNKFVIRLMYGQGSVIDLWTVIEYNNKK